LLTDKYTVDKLPAGPRGLLFRETLPKIAPLLSELRDVARQRGKTVPQVALNWNLQKGFLLLVGVRSVEQAKENLGALGWRLSPAEETALDVAASKCKVQLVQNSFQTP
jgi:pyridoxine 4-dehydrogenase